MRPTNRTFFWRNLSYPRLCKCRRSFSSIFN
ncbi:MAG: hypothetical protein F6K48_00005 [Okeania sp. SIO3H1]|nr:hypothetical protein [Okeania sp. SIO3H1]